jgi:hypothetical protein
VNIISNISLIRFHATFTTEMLILHLGASEACIVFLVFSYITLGEINERSKNVINSLRGYARRNMSVRDRRLMLKYLDSYRPLQIELGSFGHYYKRNTLSVIGKIILYTAKFLLISLKYDVK